MSIDRVPTARLTTPFPADSQGQLLQAHIELEKAVRRWAPGPYRRKGFNDDRIIAKDAEEVLSPPRDSQGEHA